MSVSAIRTKLNTKLSEMQNIKQVFNYEPNELTKYPSASVTLAGGEGEFASQAHNRHETTFKIKVYVEKGTGFSSQNAERIAISVIDEMRTAYDMDTTLSGTVKFIQAIDFGATYADRELDMRVLDINVKAIELTTSQ